MKESEDANMPCADKLAFDSRDEASVTGNLTHFRYGTKLKPYRCRHCQLWHLATDYEN